LARQGLAAPLGGDLASLVAATGWLRTLGGVEPYLALLARRPGLTLAEADAAFASRELQVLPCVRGCTYVVPRAQAGVALRYAALLARRRIERDLEKVEVPPSELAALQAEIRRVLGQGGRSVEALRAALPPGLVRSLGALGKAHGLSSALPAALRLLEFDGRVSRHPESRVDAERYEWREVDGDVFAGTPAEDDVAGLTEALLGWYLRWAAPAGLDEFVAWTGGSKRDARAAAERLGAREVEVEGLGPALSVDDREDRLDPDAVHVLASQDNYGGLRAGVRSIVDPSNHHRPAGSFGRRTSTFGEATTADGRFVIRGGLVVGLWEYDAQAKRARYGCWDPAHRSPAADRAVEKLGEFLTQGFGHGRLYSLDNAAEQQKRLAALP